MNAIIETLNYMAEAVNKAQKEVEEAYYDDYLLPDIEQSFPEKRITRITRITSYSYRKKIENIICNGEAIIPAVLQTKSRKREIVFARQVIMFFLYKYTKMSWYMIGHAYGKDHATAIHAVKTINNLADTDKKIAGKMADYDKQIRYHHRTCRTENKSRRQKP